MPECWKGVSNSVEIHKIRTKTFELICTLFQRLHPTHNMKSIYHYLLMYERNSSNFCLFIITISLDASKDSDKIETLRCFYSFVCIVYMFARYSVDVITSKAAIVSNENWSILCDDCNEFTCIWSCFYWIQALHREYSKLPLWCIMRVCVTIVMESHLWPLSVIELNRAN